MTSVRRLCSTIHRDGVLDASVSLERADVRRADMEGGGLGRGAERREEQRRRHQEGEDGDRGHQDG